MLSEVVSWIKNWPSLKVSLVSMCSPLRICCKISWVLYYPPELMISFLPFMTIGMKPRSIIMLYWPLIYCSLSHYGLGLFIFSIGIFPNVNPGYTIMSTLVPHECNYIFFTTQYLKAALDRNKEAATTPSGNQINNILNLRFFWLFLTKE